MIELPKTLGFMGADMDKALEKVCCHSCNENLYPIKQVNSLVIKCPECGFNGCDKANHHGNKCSSK